MIAGSRDRGARRAWLALAAALMLTGCGGSTAGSESSESTSLASAGSNGAPSAGTVVTAVETEFAIELLESSFSPGDYTFRVKNQGTLPHDLTIEGPGVDRQATATLQAGQSSDLQVTLQEGTYELWCSIDGHRGQGMDVTIQVG